MLSKRLAGMAVLPTWLFPIAMEQTRVEFLRKCIRNNPDDTFARYALGLELQRHDPEEAWTHFEYLLNHHPEYSATYYHAGVFLVGQGRTEEARKVFLRGIEVTKRQGNVRARNELQEALDGLASAS